MKNNLLSIPSLPYSVVIDSVKVDGIDMADAFDFCDAFASSANFQNGISLNAEQLDTLTDSEEGKTLIHELACKKAGF